MKLSIITPVFNRADCVSRCLDSVVRNLQWGIEIEHIVVDDGSCDDSPKIVKEYAQKYDHIKFIPFKFNRGVNAARNAAINISTGNYCIILDSDDYFVDNAVGIIAGTIGKYPDFQYFMFAPDDMIERYDRNPYLKENTQVLSFSDFLGGKVGSDFVHVVPTVVMKSFPFDESLRIYEGVFFLRFYKQVKNMLFTKKIVTIRERQRADSVSRDYIATKKNILERTLKANKTEIDWFYNDYVSLGYINKIQGLLKTTSWNALLCGFYNDFDTFEKYFKQINAEQPRFYKIVRVLHLGGFIRFIVTSLLYVKYKILKRDLEY